MNLRREAGQYCMPTPPGDLGGVVDDSDMLLVVYKLSICSR